MKIALVGKMRSGKDSVADMLVDNYGYTEYKLSSGINHVVKTLRLSDTELKNRAMYQKIGQFMRTIETDVWCNYTWRQFEVDCKYSELINNSLITDIVISDVRQQNEADFFREKGFIIVKIQSTDEIRRKRIVESGDIMNEEDFTHETELSVDGIDVDYIIENNGTIKELYQKVELLEKWGFILG